MNRTCAICNVNITTCDICNKCFKEWCNCEPEYFPEWVKSLIKMNRSFERKCSKETDFVDMLSENEYQDGEEYPVDY